MWITALILLTYAKNSIIRLWIKLWITRELSTILSYPQNFPQSYPQILPLLSTGLSTGNIDRSVCFAENTRLYSKIIHSEATLSTIFVDKWRISRVERRRFSTTAEDIVDDLWIILDRYA